jgi:hypothetical protein
MLCVVGALGCTGIIYTGPETRSVPSCGAFSLDPLPAEVLQHFRDYMVIDGRADATGQPHLAGHWLEYNYAGMDASLDTSWKAKRAYIDHELTHDGNNRVFRCTIPGTSGATPPRGMSQWGPPRGRRVT